GRPREFAMPRHPAERGCRLPFQSRRSRCPRYPAARRSCKRTMRTHTPLPRTNAPSAWAPPKLPALPSDHRPRCDGHRPSSASGPRRAPEGQSCSVPGSANQSVTCPRRRAFPITDTRALAVPLVVVVIEGVDGSLDVVLDDRALRLVARVDRRAVPVDEPFRRVDGERHVVRGPVLEHEGALLPLLLVEGRGPVEGCPVEGAVEIDGEAGHSGELGISAAQLVDLESDLFVRAWSGFDVEYLGQAALER